MYLTKYSILYSIEKSTYIHNIQISVLQIEISTSKKKKNIILKNFHSSFSISEFNFAKTDVSIAP